MIFYKKYKLENIPGAWGNWYLVLDTEKPKSNATIATASLKEALTWIKDHEPEAIQLTLF